MTSYERVVNTLNRKPVDQCPIVIGPWEETEKRWIKEGHYSPEQNVRELFDMDLRWEGILNMVADLDCVPETVEETEDTISMRDGNGVVLRKHKGKIANSNPAAPHYHFTGADICCFGKTYRVMRTQKKTNVEEM